MQIAAELGVEPAPAHEHAVRRGDRQRQRRVEHRAAARGRLGAGELGEPRPRRRGRIEVLRARDRGRDAAETAGHGDVHRVDRDPAAESSGVCGERAADVEREVRRRRDDVVGDELGALPDDAEVARKAGGRVEPHLAARADRAAVRRRPGEAVDADRIAVRRDQRADAGELEAGLIVAEASVRERDRPARLGLRERAAQLHRDRQRAADVSAAGRKQGVGEARRRAFRRS